MWFRVDMAAYGWNSGIICMCACNMGQASYEVVAGGWAGCGWMGGRGRCSAIVIEYVASPPKGVGVPAQYNHLVGESRLVRCRL